ncbi:MAG: PEP-CTERM sorting domain-containing protein [Verrucomicrobiae bacterium]|nr:PEP-CTERM sorting domain-containing protein [Verrucomicrobiae bacterium]
MYGTVETEGYESYASDLASGARTLSLDSFQVGYDLVGDISNFGIATVPNPFGGSGVSATAGTHYLYAVFPTEAASAANVTFQFASPVHAFGTDIRDLENISLSYGTSTGESGTAATPAASGTIRFFGIVSDNPFTSITITGPGLTTGDGVVFDQTSFVVPEPRSALLLLTGSLAALILRWRRHPAGRA